jgi:hypothetical protein
MSLIKRSQGVLMGRFELDRLAVAERLLDTRA